MLKIVGGLFNVGIAEISKNPNQPRKKFDEEELLVLADSIRTFGVITPLTVRRTKTGYELVAGERRLRAAKLAGLDTVPCYIVETNEKESSFMALVENLQREDLNPIEEAQGFKSLIDDYGLTQDEAAKSVGRSRPAVTNALRLLSLPENIASLVKKGELSAGHARALLPLPTAQMQYNVAYTVMQRGLSVRKTEELVAKKLKELEKEADTGESGVEIDYVADTSEWLTRVLARKVQLRPGRKGGKIELEYYDSDDREELIKNLAQMMENWTK